ncbi:hypothetical protein EON64_13715, partial [archaeon]
MHRHDLNALLTHPFLPQPGIKNAADMLAGEEGGVMLREPNPLKGVAERKGAFRLGGGAWKEVYVEVRTPGYLYIFKDKK